jgi:hypothetical protein
VKHLLVIALAAATLTAADATGTWTGTLTPSDGQPGPAHVVLKQEGDKLTGTAGPDASEQHPIQNGRAENGTLTFELQTGDTLMKVTLAPIVRAEAAIARAENAPAPPASITARITGSMKTTIKTQGAGIVAGDGLVLNGAQAMGAGFKQINLVCLAVPEGTHTVNVQNGSINTLQFPGIAVNFGNGVGTATVTRNNANRTAFGTFTFTATGVSGTTGTITVTGEFTGTF